MRPSRSVFSSIVVAAVAVFWLSAHSARSDEDDDDPKAGPPKSRPAPKPKAPEAKAEPKAKPPEAKAEPKPAAKADPFGNPEAKTEAKPEQKAVPKAEPAAKTTSKTHARDLEDPFSPSHGSARAEMPRTSRTHEDPFARPAHADAPTAKAPPVTIINRSPDGESLPAGSGAGRPVRVRLVDGSTVVGKIRAEREETLVVDCALGQLMIPRSRISTIGYDDSAKPGRNDMLGDVFTR